MGVFLRSAQFAITLPGSKLTWKSRKIIFLELTLFSVIHRADYHDVLLTEARRLGAELILDAEVVNIGFATATVYLKNGTAMKGDIVVGADGEYSFSYLTYSCLRC